jgi:hypothetical protein
VKKRKDREAPSLERDWGQRKGERSQPWGPVRVRDRRKNQEVFLKAGSATWSKGVGTFLVAGVNEDPWRTRKVGTCSPVLTSTGLAHPSSLLPFLFSLLSFSSKVLFENKLW